MSFRDYLELWDPIAVRIRNNPSLISVDGSIDSYFNYNRTNYGPDPPNPISYVAFTRAINPNAVMVLLLRDPITRLFSSYKHVIGRSGGLVTQQGFHNAISLAIGTWKQCMTKYKSPRRCVHSQPRTNKGGILYTALLQSIYYVIVENIRALVAPSKLVIVRAEDYYADRSHTLATIFRKLRLPPLKAADMTKVVRTAASNKSPVKVTMSAATKQKIKTFIQPYNEILAKVMNDDRFLWKGS